MFASARSDWMAWKWEMRFALYWSWIFLFAFHAHSHQTTAQWNELEKHPSVPAHRSSRVECSRNCYNLTKNCTRQDSWRQFNAVRFHNDTQSHDLLTNRFIRFIHKKYHILFHHNCHFQWENEQKKTNANQNSNGESMLEYKASNILAQCDQLVHCGVSVIHSLPVHLIEC